MRRATFLAGAALVWGLIAQAQVAPPRLTLKTGDRAPDFTLPSTTGKDISLSEFRGKKNVVLAFFFAAFTGG